MEDVVDDVMVIAGKYNPDQFEAYESRNRLITIRMAVNEIVEAKCLLTEGVSVRLILKNSIGFASTTDLTKTGIKKTVSNAYKIAKSKRADPDFRTLPAPQKVAPLEKGYDKGLLDIELEEAVEYGAAALKTCRELDSKIDLSGSINVVSEECHIRNSLDVDVSDVSAFVYSSITTEKGEEVSAMGQTCSRTLKGFDPTLVVKEAVDAVWKCRGCKGIEPRKYDVIFGPHSCADLTEYVLAYGLDLSAVDTGFSYFRGKLGTEVAVEDFTLRDDGRHLAGIASKMVDDEGVPTQRTDLIREGGLKNFLCDTYYANKLSSHVREFLSTGNGFRFGPVPGRDFSVAPRVQPTNFVIEAGRSSLDELIKETKQGILIDRIWYTYPINPTAGEFSTTNRGSTFYIEKGEVKHPIPPNSFRINDSLPKLLMNILDLSKDQVQSVVWGGISSCISPYIKFKEVNITYSKE